MEHLHKNILVVEDEGLIALDLERRLRALGYGICATTGAGDEAIHLAEQHRPDLVLMDIRLKGAVDGIDAAAAIKQRYGIPFVYVTSYTDHSTVERAKATEPLAYLVKPFSDRELHTSIEIALQRHLMEVRIAENSAWLASVLRSIGDAVVATDDKGAVKLLNPVAEQLTGWTEREAAGKHFSEIVRLFDFASRQPLDPIGRVLARHRPLELGSRLQLQQRNGNELPVEDSASPIDGNGQLLGGLFVFRDMTRTLELREQMERLQRMEAVGRLAAGVAHDFNNLLTIILGMASLASAEVPATSSVYKALGDISHAAHRAALLTQKLLALARKQILAPRAFDLNAALEDTAVMIRPLLGEAIEFEIQANAANATVFADPLQIEQAVLNMLLNAREAVAGTGMIIARTENHDDAEIGPAVRLSITDTGPGIAPEVRPHIFEPFFTTKAESQGTGLGLATAYGIVTQSGGRIDVATDKGIGSTFSVVLPLHETRPGSTAAESAASGMQPQIPPRITVLVAEDEIVLRKLIVRILSGYGIEPIEARDVRAALRLARSWPRDVDVLVTDIVMPGLDGARLAHRLRERWPELKIVFVSGYTPDPKLLYEFPDGTAAFVGKPFNALDLVTAIAQLIKGAKA